MSAPPDACSALGDEHAALGDLLAGLGAADWERPTRCEGWTVADVVLHLSQSDALALAALAGDFGRAAAASGAPGAPGAAPTTVDQWAEAGVAAGRGATPDEVHRRWRRSAADVDRALAGTDGHRRVPWVAGELSVTTLATTRLAEAWIHGGDVADAVGATVAPTDRLWHVARLAWRTLPYALARERRALAGPVAFSLEGTDGDPWDFVPDAPAATVVRGPAVDLCLVAGRRLDAGETALVAEGPDAGAVLALVRTYA